MTSERYLQLCSTDKNVQQKLAIIDEDLIWEEMKFLRHVCSIADKADLDRRIALRTALLLMDDLWDEMIMIL